MAGAHRIRRASPADIEPVALLFREIRQACLPYLPDLHSPAEDLAFFRDHVFGECDLARRSSIPRRLLRLQGGWVDHLYVRQPCHGQGLGRALLAKAMEAQDRLRLWVFQRNAPAIAFYRARGFRETLRTDGSANEEREPDALFEWTRDG
jgi:Sortase and related acyltransferases